MRARFRVRASVRVIFSPRARANAKFMSSARAWLMDRVG